MVSIWLTKGDKTALLQPQSSVTFGAAMTDSSAWLIYNRMKASQREALMRALFSSSEGIGIENCSDQSGCDQSIGYTETGDYLSYQVDFGSGVSNVSLRVASGSTGGTVELRLGSPTGTLIGSIPVTNTGGWGIWTTKSASVTGATGVQDLYLIFQGEPAETSSDGMLNLNWFRFN